MTDSPTNGTVPAPVERKKNGQFVRGHRGYGGRKPGSRVKLSEAFLADFVRSWKKHGPRVFDEVAEKHPETYLRIAVTALPKAMEVDGILNVQHHSTVHVEARDFLEAYQRWGQHIGANPPPMIEAQAIEDETESDEHA